MYISFAMHHCLVFLSVIENSLIKLLTLVVLTYSETGLLLQISAKMLVQEPKTVIINNHEQLVITNVQLSTT